MESSQTAIKQSLKSEWILQWKQTNGHQWSKDRRYTTMAYTAVCNRWRTGTKVQQTQWTTTIAGFSSRKNSELSRLYTSLYWILMPQRPQTVKSELVVISKMTQRESVKRLSERQTMSVSTGEMAAVHHALSEVRTLDIDQREKVAIFTDSLSTVRIQSNLDIRQVDRTCWERYTNQNTS